MRQGVATSSGNLEMALNMQRVERKLRLMRGWWLMQVVVSRKE
jgi:hypothetical protein